MIHLWVRGPSLMACGRCGLVGGVTNQNDCGRRRKRQTYLPLKVVASWPSWEPQQKSLRKAAKGRA